MKSILSSETYQLERRIEDLLDRAEKLIRSNYLIDYREIGIGIIMVGFELLDLAARDELGNPIELICRYSEVSRRLLDERRKE